MIFYREKRACYTLFNACCRYYLNLGGKRGKREVFMLNRNLNEEFEIFKRNAADKSISCEIVAGHVVQSVMTGED